MIVTKRIRDGRSVGIDEAPMETLRTSPVGRMVLEDRRVYVTTKAVADWCRDNKIPPSLMRKELDRSGLLLLVDGLPSRMLRVGAGSTVPSSLTRCYELNFDMLYGSGIGLHVVKNQTPKEAVHEAS